METQGSMFSKFLELAKSWFPRFSDPAYVSRDFWMPDSSCRVCYDCDTQFTIFVRKHHCRLCGRVFCRSCTTNSIPVPSAEPKSGRIDRDHVRVCKFCFKQWEQDVAAAAIVIQPSNVDMDNSSWTTSMVSTRSSGLESCTSMTAGSMSYSNEPNQRVPYGSGPSSVQSMRIDPGADKHDFHMLEWQDDSIADKRDACYNHFSYYNIRSNSDDDGNDDCQSNSGAQHFQHSEEYYSRVEYGRTSHDSDINRALRDEENLASQEVLSYENITEAEPDHSVECGASSIHSINSFDEPADFENNGLLWLPPEPEDVEDERQEVLFDDNDDDDTTGEWGYLHPSNSFGSHESHTRDPSSDEHKKAMKNVVDGHFRALIAHFLLIENLPIGEEGDKQSWLEIITSLSWEAAKLLRPNTSQDGRMDPGGYVKVKCVGCGLRSQSVVVKGVVCKKNVAHRRMRLKLEKPKILILGGGLEYQRVMKSLSCFDTLLQQEMDHLKMAVARIKVHDPHVLLVEKSVSRVAQNYLLAKDISLVLNIQRSLLERISRCTDAQIVPSIDHLSSAKLGTCDLFNVEKFLEVHATDGQAGKKMLKTLMFFEGCPNPLGCTILLQGASGDELKKVKHVIQYGVFAAYHLALETSFLADEGASIPKLPLQSPLTVALPNTPSCISRSISTLPYLASDATESTVPSSGFNAISEKDSLKATMPAKVELQISPSSSDNKSILVSLSSRCVWKGTICEKSHLRRIKYYSSFDKSLGKFLREHLFDKCYRCPSCDMPSEAHIHRYTHQQGNLTISVRKLPKLHLPGKLDGKIWMWHRCLRCPRLNGFPPSTTRIAMSDAAWGLSFGKFLELSFSDHAAASRVANCGHSLHRDCLRFYGFGKMVACFRYASIIIHSVYLPLHKLDFNYEYQEWIHKEAKEVDERKELLFSQVLKSLPQIADKWNTLKFVDGSAINPECSHHIHELKEMLQKVKEVFEESLNKMLRKEVKEGEPFIDILEINKLKRQLVFLSYLWDQLLVFANESENLQEFLSGFLISDTEKFLTYVKLTDLNALNEYNPVYVSSFWELEHQGWGRLLLPVGENEIVIPVYDNEPTSIISYALASTDYHIQMSDDWERTRDVDSSFQSALSDSVNFHSFNSANDLDFETFKSFGSAEESIMSLPGSISSVDALLYSNKMHVKVSFEDDGPLERVKYTVTCYYARLFDALRRACCPSELDYIRSLSRCKKWRAQGGKSNVFFAKSLDDRFIIKQITKTEIESFIKFAPGYFKYLLDSIATGSPTCLAKILGIYQVSTKHLKSRKEAKIDVLVMENILFGRNVIRLYDLKGSSRSRYNPDLSGNNKILLDQNLIEAMPTSPIFVDNKAKRLLERAIWNDTSFLASIDVMDYSLLVGDDEMKHELVIGIIDFVRQYTWDKHLETWVKASGILGGPKSTSPTVVSPEQYKKRFRKAMSTYFIVVPDQHPPPPSIAPSELLPDLDEDDIDNSA